ncbi:MAG: crossover junction endodeoxyribonuclease RuvC [Oligoflexia bacterium]|nr:crossover junction endodeoxyribonuclease RuvC [Oligoflexia bacterium]
MGNGGGEIILGIDPGSIFTGYGVVTEARGFLQCLAFGVIESTQSEKMQNRLLTIGSNLSEIIKKYKPSAISIEKTFYAKNADSAAKLGQARGVCLYEGAKAKVNIFEYNPTEVKKGLTGSGRAEKEQVQMMVKALLGLPTMGRYDASDALALAIHHLRVSATMKNILKSELLT